MVEKSVFLQPFPVIGRTCRRRLAARDGNGIVDFAARVGVFTVGKPKMHLSFRIGDDQPLPVSIRQSGEHIRRVRIEVRGHGAADARGGVRWRHHSRDVSVGERGRSAGDVEAARHRGRAVLAASDVRRSAVSRAALRPDGSAVVEEVSRRSLVAAADSGGARSACRLHERVVHVDASRRSTVSSADSGAVVSSRRTNRSAEYPHRAGGVVAHREQPLFVAAADAGGILAALADQHVVAAQAGNGQRLAARHAQRGAALLLRIRRRDQGVRSHKTHLHGRGRRCSAVEGGVVFVLGRNGEVGEDYLAG